MTRPRFIVGIDLGTTNTVVAFADTGASSGAPAVSVFAVPQLVAPGEVSAQPLLPSARYHPAEHEFAEGTLTLPWIADHALSAPAGIVGALALRAGSAVPQRLVTSAKSWLSHGAVDRSAAILPWGSPPEVPKVSPVDASASYLAHVRGAWDAAHPEHPLSEAEIVLTIPASFDEVARSLTLEAASRAGLPKVRLVEEPQAAFYDWLERNQADLDGALAGTKLVLVADVGGGTTDLSLISAESRESGPRLTRIAVGEHLMLGGDNMDLLLARHLEPSLAGGDGATLGAQRFGELLAQCRAAKERLLDPGAPDRTTVTVLGGGSRLIGGSKSAELTRADLERLVLEGFFPAATPADSPGARRGGLVEFGLPYVADAAITRHLAEFLRRHEALARTALEIGGKTAGNAMPDAVLMNGGVFLGATLRDRLVQTLSEWRGAPVRVLENPHPDLAVARGAVAFALARRGVGLRIGGGSARTFFLMLGAGKGAENGGGGAPAKPAVVVLPRGSEEGEELTLEGKTFSLRVGAPVRFRLATSTSEVAHRRAGDLVDLADEAHLELPPLAVVLGVTQTGTAGASDAGGEAKNAEVPVHVVAALTEIGTLEMSCVRVDAANQRWKLEFQLRGQSSSSGALEQIRQLHPRFAEATDKVRRVFGKGAADVHPRETKTLRADLEKILGDRATWDTPLLRELFGALWAGAKHRRRSADHERVWLNLTGYCLRPGYGYPLDDYRVSELFTIFGDGIQYVPEAQNWAEWWILWRRIAGGLSPDAQEKILASIEWYLEPEGPRPRPKPSGPRKLAEADMVRLAGVLEHLSIESKSRVGAHLLKRLTAKDENPHTWWAVGRIGARVPFYGSAHRVIPPDTASAWIAEVLRAPWTSEDPRAFAATLMARVSGDRTRDLEPALRNEVRTRLESIQAPAAWARMVTEATHLDAGDERRVFGESLPPGLRLL
jgi:molecular chaperone DnaK (HSP70)